MNIKIKHIGEINYPITQALPHIPKRHLKEDFEITIEVTTKIKKVVDVVRYHIKIDAGFMWDGMSIPKFAWSFVGSPFQNKHIIAGLVHDWLYKNHICTRYEADRIMLYILKQQKDGYINRNVMYRVVRSCGGKHYNKSGE